MTQKQTGRQQSNGGGNQGSQGSQGQRESSSGKGAEKQQQSSQGGQGGQETPEQWLEENSLGDPTQTGNTITGENEY